MDIKTKHWRDNQCTSSQKELTANLKTETVMDTSDLVDQMDTIHPSPLDILRSFKSSMMESVE